MALEPIPIPLKGVNYSYPLDKQDAGTSAYMNNIRPFDTLERRIRIGQRPGLDKMYTQQIGGTAAPIVALHTVTTIDE
jgi:hypothetical protein